MSSPDMKTQTYGSTVLPRDDSYLHEFSMALSANAAASAAGVKIADARPLGLAAFALTTFVLSAHNAGWAPDVVWIGLAAFYGGLAQFVAGMWQYRRNCVFTSTAFTTYGAFWMALGLVNIFYLADLIPSTVNFTVAVGWFLLGFVIFNSYMTICALMMSKVELVVFALLEITLLLLAIGHLRGDKAGEGVTEAGAIVGVITAAAAYYYSCALVFNGLAKRTILFVGSPVLSFKPVIQELKSEEDVV